MALQFRKRRLSSISLSGFKSIKELSALQLGSLNVLIGANGSGKSNLLSFFRLLGWMTQSPGNLQHFIGKQGGANGLLFDGAETTPDMNAILGFEDSFVQEYCLELTHAAGDTFVFSSEEVVTGGAIFGKNEVRIPFGTGHRETKLFERKIFDVPNDTTLRSFAAFFEQSSVYHFSNTSETARIRQKCDIHDNYRLKTDGANLAPHLRRMKELHPAHYERIVATIRTMIPFFGDFVFDVEYNHLLLKWQERGSDAVFAAHQASDGMLRIMCLATLLLQPKEEPAASTIHPLIILDEPELGLHPAAIEIIAGLIRAASVENQVILATQSINMLDHFDVEDVIVVDRMGRESRFERLDPNRLQEWLEEYSLSALWEKNVLGGRPRA